MSRGMCGLGTAETFPPHFSSTTMITCQSTNVNNLCAYHDNTFSYRDVHHRARRASFTFLRYAAWTRRTGGAWLRTRTQKGGLVQGVDGQGQASWREPGAEGRVAGSSGNEA